MVKIQTGLEEVMAKHDIVIGEVSGADFSDDCEIPGLAIMQDVETALPRCLAMISIFEVAAAKEGELADAAALKRVIDAAPADLDIPIDILGNVARRAATETGLDIEELAAILDVSDNATCEYGIGHARISLSDKIILADSIMMTAFCNFARDPSTPRNMMATVTDAFLSVVHHESDMVPGLADMKVLFDKSYTAFNASDVIDVSAILKNIKDPLYKFQKPFQVNWPILKACRKAAVDFVLEAEMSQTHKSKICSLCDLTEELTAARTEHKTQPTTSRLMTIRTGLTSLRSGASREVLHLAADQLTQIEEFLAGECNLQLAGEDVKWGADTELLMLEIIAILENNEREKLLDTKDPYNSEMMVPLWVDWCKRMGEIKIKSANAIGIKSYASPEAIQEWEKIIKCRGRVCEVLPKILTIAFSDKDNNLLLAGKFPNDMVTTLAEFNTILSRCGHDSHKLCYFPNAEFVDRFHAVFTKILPPGTGVCFYIGLLGLAWV